MKVVITPGKIEAASIHLKFEYLRWIAQGMAEYDTGGRLNDITLLTMLRIYAKMG